MVRNAYIKLFEPGARIGLATYFLPRSRSTTEPSGHFVTRYITRIVPWNLPRTSSPVHQDKNK